MSALPPNQHPRAHTGSEPVGSEDEPNRNGTPHEAPGDSPTPETSEKPSGLDRAEVIVDKVADRVAVFANTLWGKRILTAAERAREAAQDFWAEVQNVRHGRSS
jgi:hypothetical protein